jgi:hypothetical protein
VERHEVGHQETPAGVGERFGLIVPAHIQKVTHTYFIDYPDHEERADDPHYKDFHHWREATKSTAKCVVGQHRDDYSECYPPPEHWPIGLEVHHSVIEFAVQNGIDLAWLERDFPGVSDPNSIGAWVESPVNLEWRCVFHHRGVGGVHTLTASDYEGVKYVKGLTSDENP